MTLLLRLNATDVAPSDDNDYEDDFEDYADDFEDDDDDDHKSTPPAPLPKASAVPKLSISQGQR